LVDEQSLLPQGIPALQRIEHMKKLNIKRILVIMFILLVLTIIAMTKMPKTQSEEQKSQGISHTIVLAAGVYYLRPGDYERPDMQRALDYASIAHRNARTSAATCVFLFSDEDL
jgi:hypothetical protein